MTIDLLVDAADTALRTLFSRPGPNRPPPHPTTGARPALSEAERTHAGALMRVNHVGEICAQALYSAQALTCKDPELRKHLGSAAKEETDHLAWTRARMDDLGARPSLLNPVWYLGSFAMGLAAGLNGKVTSLGFVVETERQVGAHLQSHMDMLPANDIASRLIVSEMQLEEAQHGENAKQLGGAELSKPIQSAMRLASQVMTKTAYYV